MNQEEIARYWCHRSGIAWLDVPTSGMTPYNKVVPFGDGGRQRFENQ
jgi:hypothetical protein